MPNASVIDLSALVEGPYGFSFELSRTTDAPAAGGATGEVAGVTARESAGRTAATAAPAPSNRANCRREIEIVFMDFLRSPLFGLKSYFFPKPKASPNYARSPPGCSHGPAGRLALRYSA